ncbi:hypothetical protein [Wolbachia pipientis]|uniref:hypothetical protein n=1 Tax=Wolbachia pipientis TaxID=955 RepID=UPI001C71575B|nr:hypothetical protein [Wolbachia pipientis]
MSGHWDGTIYCKDLPHIYSMIIFLDHLVYLFCHSAERIQNIFNVYMMYLLINVFSVSYLCDNHFIFYNIYGIDNAIITYP